MSVESQTAAARVQGNGGSIAPSTSLSTDERLRQMEMLLKVSREVSAIDTLGEVLVALVRIATTETGADRGTLWLYDPQTSELYSRVALGTSHREIRVLNTHGVVGRVFNTGQGIITNDAYSHPLFDRSVDKSTGYVTKSILAAPIRTAKGEIMGVIQTLNKQDGLFNENDLHLLEQMTTQAAITLQSRQFVERMEKSREAEMEFLDVVSDVSSELELRPLLQKIMNEAKRMLKADRATLFLNDDKTNELWSEVGTGLGATQIRFPNHLGIAGAVYTRAQSVNIPYAYADLRFNPAFDKKTGYFTRSILCVPVVNKLNKAIGAVQCLNKLGGPFSHEDETRLKAFSAKISLGLENAKLFADIQNMKNYNESILESMSSAVLTLDVAGKIVTCNSAGLRMMSTTLKGIIGKTVGEYFTSENIWVKEKVDRVEKSQEPENTVDAELVFGGEKKSVNMTVQPLISVEKTKIGTMLLVEDISGEKRLKSTMSRYMDPALADQLLAGGEDMLGGRSTLVTVLFSDLRGFTTITEKLGAQGTVTLLNEYFTIMVDCLQREGGMLDKYIGDAMMAAFGIPMAHEDDEDRAVRTAIAMLTELAAFNKMRAGKGQDPIDMGVGLNTDMVVSGNVGSPKRMDYTIMGDGVNLAARLESACKYYHARILLSENTYNKLRGQYRIREVDRVVVKGKTKPIAIYEVLDYHTEETFPNMTPALESFGKGLTRYRQGQWDKAIEAFKEALGKNPMDGAAQMYVERCEELKVNPPGEDWTGTWVLTSK